MKVETRNFYKFLGEIFIFETILSVFRVINKNRSFWCFFRWYFFTFHKNFETRSFLGPETKGQNFTEKPPTFWPFINREAKILRLHKLKIEIVDLRMKVPISQIQVFHEQVLVLMPIRFTNCMPLISRAAEILEVLYSEYHQSGL